MMDKKQSAPSELGRVQGLMMAAVDGEISADDRAELDAALTADMNLRDEWEAFRRLREVTETMTTRTPPEEVWDGYIEGVYRRFERGLGWVLFSIGTIVVLTWGSWTWVQQILAETETPAFVRWSILALTAGLVVLFVSVARERLFTRKDDPYKDVVR